MIINLLLIILTKNYKIIKNKYPFVDPISSKYTLPSIKHILACILERWWSSLKVKSAVYFLPTVVTIFY